jgi:iron-sulfur cluster assembly protein
MSETEIHSAANEPAAPPVAHTDGPEAGAPIVVTPKAIDKIRQTFAKQGVEGFLRLGILGGGCSGLSYQFKFDTRSRANDKIFEFDGVKIVVDPKSFLYLSGLTLDYKETLMQSGFEFINPHATKSCGCGTSFAG